MSRRIISRINEDSKFSLLCKVDKVRVSSCRRFLVLRVKDNTRSAAYFRKFNLDDLDREMQDTGTLEVWKVPSKRVDVVVSVPPEDVITFLRRGKAILLHNVVCRVLCTWNFPSPVHELHVNTQQDGRVQLMPCDDLSTCIREGFTQNTVTEEFPYVGWIKIEEIRKGLSFSLICKVVQCGRERDTGQVVLQLKDATFTKICVKKYDVDFEEVDLDNSQSSKDLGFYKQGSAVIEVLLTSLSQDIGNIKDKIMSLDRVVCDGTPSCLPHPASPLVHFLYINAADPSFSMELRKPEEQVTKNLLRCPTKMMMIKKTRARTVTKKLPPTRSYSSTHDSHLWPNKTLLNMISMSFYVALYLC
ncbi:uncharacterized protein LOC126998392 [Eriocheir sinensis]|uniref:uncharacterized protein LOC126998392 n=1 Tax=Eriocheir sinensis TaxID=95602 RepID=UPI0021CA5724|nr:uncharacterized protein LOC126998392 [Eriocheir sinensis]